MKQITTLSILALGLAIGMVSCNNQPKPADTPVAADTPKPAPAPAAFQPYKAMLVIHTVKDFDKWLPVFKASDSLVKNAGLSNPGVGRGLDNDKLVIVFSTASDIAKAKEFAASPGLKAAMAKSGVTGPPTISFVDVIMDDTTTIPQHERLMITHHVKDFDVWKKAYDADSARRSATGLIQRGMTRGVDDPNMVGILFAVTDVAKAKAAMANTDMKKVMEAAGVDGPPTITWFKWVSLN